MDIRAKLNTDGLMFLSIRQLDKHILQMQIWLLPSMFLVLIGLVGLCDDANAHILHHLSFGHIVENLACSWPLLSGITLLLLHLLRMIPYIQRRVEIEAFAPDELAEFESQLARRQSESRSQPGQSDLNNASEIIGA